MKKKKTIPEDRKPPTKVSAPFGRCVVCGQPLGKIGGMGETGMCGPCCTGESETLSEKGISW